jgi:3-methyladenine DNA glycosylase AlkD
MSVDAALVAAVRAALTAAGDPARAVTAQAYMKSAMPFRGVPVPQVRRLTRDLLAAHPLADRRSWHDTVLALWDGATHREERYAALALVRSRSAAAFQDLAALDLYRHLVVTGAWWDLVDELAHAVGAVLREVGAPAAAVVRAWSRDEDLWLRRVAILCQLGAGAATDRALLADCISVNLADREFFIRKAIGWALRDLARPDRAWVTSFVEAAGDRLSPLSRREATRRLPGHPSGLRGAPAGAAG